MNIKKTMDVSCAAQRADQANFCIFFLQAELSDCVEVKYDNKLPTFGKSCINALFTD